MEESKTPVLSVLQYNLKSVLKSIPQFIENKSQYLMFEIIVTIQCLNTFHP